MDQELERAIDAALDEARATRPSPDFLPRLRAHVEQLPPAPIRWWIPLAASVTTIAAGVIVAATISRQPAVVNPQSPVVMPQSAAVNPHSAVGDPRSVLDNPGPPSGNPKPKLHNPQSSSGRAATREPEVLVPKSDRMAVARLLEALAAGDAHAIAVMQSVRDAGEPAGVAVTPIEIAPVVVPPLKESL